MEDAPQVRCPSERCGIVFEPPARWLGRNMYCPACGVRMTARPVQVETELRRRLDRSGPVPGPAPSRLPWVAMLDNVRSLWNVGSIFRTADACGVSKLVLTGISGCPPRPEIRKTALGAETAVAWEYRTDGAVALGRLHEAGYVPLALEAGPGAVSLERVEWPERIALVVGNEVAGISPAVLESCRIRVAIPMLGVKSSLNVAVAFGIAAHRIASVLLTREVRHGGV